VADIMKSAGLTHGGFYGHFASKEELMAEACRRAFGMSVGRWRKTVDERGPQALSTITRAYLSPRHRDAAGSGCTVAALGAEAARQGPGVKRVMSEGIEAGIEALARAMPGPATAAKRRKALANYAAMVGALMLSRAIDDPDRSKEVLDAVTERVEGAGARRKK
jgi:TetR/AcrR family transcriptional repressor of nem operon